MGRFDRPTNLGIMRQFHRKISFLNILRLLSPSCVLRSALLVSKQSDNKQSLFTLDVSPNCIPLKWAESFKTHFEENLVPRAESVGHAALAAEKSGTKICNLTQRRSVLQPSRRAVRSFN